LPKRTSFSLTNTTKQHLEKPQNVKYTAFRRVLRLLPNHPTSKTHFFKGGW
jgi:hypothetical protein